MLTGSRLLNTLEFCCREGEGELCDLMGDTDAERREEAVAWYVSRLSEYSTLVTSYPDFFLPVKAGLRLPRARCAATMALLTKLLSL